MEMNSFMVALMFGILMYLFMFLDNLFIEPTNKMFVSPKIPLLSMLLAWIIWEFGTNSTIPTMGGGFYN